MTSAETAVVRAEQEFREKAKAVLPSGLDLYDVWIGPTSTLFFLAKGIERDSIALVNGDDLLDRLAMLLKAKYLKGEEMAKEKEIGMSPKASKKAKEMDKKMDKKMGVKEGSAKDIAMDKALMKKYPAKKGK